MKEVWVGSPKGMEIVVDQNEKNSLTWWSLYVKMIKYVE